MMWTKYGMLQSFLLGVLVLNAFNMFSCGHIRDGVFALIAMSVPIIGIWYDKEEE